MNCIHLKTIIAHSCGFQLCFLFKEKMSQHALPQYPSSSPEGEGGVEMDKGEKPTQSENGSKFHFTFTASSSFSPLTPTTRNRRNLSLSKLAWSSPQGGNDDSKDPKSKSSVSSSPISERIRSLKIHTALLKSSPLLLGASPRKDHTTMTSNVSTQQSTSTLDSHLDDNFTPSLFCKLISYDELSTQGTDKIVCSKVETIEFPELSIRHKVMKEDNKTLFDYPPEVSLIQCESGMDHYIFVFRFVLLYLLNFTINSITSSNGSVYVLGSNQKGEIGLGFEVEEIEGIYAHKNKFFDIEKKRGCLRVSCGASHSIFECEDGNIYGCGR